MTLSFASDEAQESRHRAGKEISDKAAGVVAMLGGRPGGETKSLRKRDAITVLIPLISVGRAFIARFSDAAAG